MADTRHTGRTVLVVEDDALVRVVTRRLLEAAGHRVLLAEGPESAIELFRDHAPAVDLLVTDLSMPGMSGQSLANVLRGQAEGLRVLFLSGYPATDVGLEAGAAFLAKPFSREEFLDKVASVLDR